MKKISRLYSIVIASFAISVFCIVAATAFITWKFDSKNYAQTAVVMDVNRDDDVVVCEDYNGNTWEFYGTEDWIVGDCVSLIMNDSGTQEIYDDEIISVRYSGWVIHR